MLTKRLWMLITLSRKLGVRVSLLAVLAVIVAAAARTLDPLIPQDWEERFGREAVMPVLDILASSMLAVIAFSLSIMVMTHRQAASQVTPRSHRLLLEDTTTQTVLATFLGAFVFALTAIILFRAGYYAGGAAVVIFGLTVLIVALVVVAILTWVDHLSHLGSMDQTLSQIEARTREALRLHRRGAALGAKPIEIEDIPDDTYRINAKRSGYVQFIDFPGLAEHSCEEDIGIYLTVMPGTWIARGQTIARLSGCSEDDVEIVREKITLADIRNFDQDARFGLRVMAEIAARALSPGLNDPGTAMDVIGRLERLLADTEPFEGDEPSDKEGVRLYGPRVTEAALIERAFSMIARDGAGMIEVARALILTLNRLRDCDPPEMAEAAEGMAGRALDYAEAALPLRSECEELHRLAAL